MQGRMIAIHAAVLGELCSVNQAQKYLSEIVPLHIWHALLISNTWCLGHVTDMHCYCRCYARHDQLECNGEICQHGHEC